MKHKIFKDSTHAMLAFQEAIKIARELPKGHYRRIQDPQTGRAGNMCGYKFSDGRQMVVFDSYDVAKEVYPKIKPEEYEEVSAMTMQEVKLLPALEVH